jgi:hypothetical protein
MADLDAVKALAFEVIREGEALGRAEHGPGRSTAKAWDVVAKDFLDLATKLGR